MPKYNTRFDLTLKDMELIEAALQSAAANDDHAADPKDINDLLGRLHNQKIFFRPKGQYISG